MSGPRLVSGWPTAPDQRVHFVYRVYDADDQLLYIGRTCKPRNRWSQHRRDQSAWVPFAHHCRMTGPMDYAAAHDLEGRLIYEMQPPYNKRGLLGGTDANPRKWSA